jgi:hypothetical protein
MNPFLRFCQAARKPVEVFVYLMCALNVLASSSVGLKAFQHQWRWVLFNIFLFCLVILIVSSRTLRRLSKESTHVG